jgi:hypothetical protein
MSLMSDRGFYVLSVMATVLALLSVQPIHAEIARPYPQGTSFPLELYEVENGDVPKLVSYGWNIFQSYKMHTPENYSAYLSALSASHATGLAAIPCSKESKNKMEWPEPKVQPWVRAIARNSNVAWWDLPEEMRPWAASELKLLQNYTAWTRASDPARRPTYEYTPNNRNAAQISRIVPAVDVIGISCYCEELQMPHAWVRYKIQEAGLHGIALAGATVGKDYLHGQKIPVAIIYCAEHYKTGRMPTPEQTYHDFWSAVVSGAQGVGVYAYFHAIKDSPVLAQNLRLLNDAATQITGPEKIGDVILRGSPIPDASCEILSGPAKTVLFRPPTEKIDFQYPSINLLARTMDGAVYVIAVNSTEQTVTARISGLPADAVSAMLPFEDRSVTINGGSLVDSFSAWGVHIYKVAGKTHRQ